MPSLRLRNLTLGYDRHPAVHHLNGDVPLGSLLAIVGPNGAGKSTLLKGIAGMLRPLEGAVELDGIARRDIAYLPQIADLDRSFPLTIIDLVSAGDWRNSGFLGRISKKRRELLYEAIAAVGLTGFENRVIGSLSGGQLQRALFARLIVQDARVILLDEPFTAIDAKTVSDLIGIVHRWHGETRTVVAVLHDLDFVREHFPQTLLLARQQVAWEGTKEALSAEKLLSARRMLEANDPFANICTQAA